jgi:translocation and assembly module TamB
VKRALKWTAAALGALLVLLLGIAAWGVSTQSGTRSIARIAVDALGGKLALGQVEGTIAGPLTVTGLRYNDPEAGIDARLQRVYVDVVLTDLFRARVHVHDLQVSGVDVGLSEPTKPPEKSTKPFSLKPPIDVVIDSLALESARIHRDQALLVELTRAAFGGHWTSRDLAVKQLEVHSPQGKIEFAGSVRQRGIYMGGGHGSFRWKAASARMRARWKRAAKLPMPRCY